jgi:hypothetical protein
MKTTQRLLVTLPLLTLAACAPASRAPARDARGDDQPISVDVRVSMTGERPETLLSSHMDVAPHRAVMLEHEGPKLGIERLTFNASPRDGDLVRVDLDWRERTADGRIVEWKPSVMVKRGSEAVAKVDWAGGGRTIALTVR